MTDSGSPAPALREAPLPGGVIAQRLQGLWEARPASVRAVAAAINEAAGQQVVSATYLSDLRAGKRAEPSFSVLSAIARYFGVTVGYFEADEETAAGTLAELRLLASLRDSGALSIALCADGLSPESLATIAEVIRAYRASEGLPPPEAPSGPAT